MKTKYELINPQMAKRIIDKNNFINRPLSKRRVEQYVDDMKRGKWNEEVGDSIKFDINGKLLDGQHRLWAVYLSGVSIKFRIDYDLQTETFMYIDTGKSRSASDVLSIKGAKQPDKIVQIIRRCKSFRDGTYINKGYSGGPSKFLTNERYVELYEEKIDFWHTVTLHSQKWYNAYNHLLPNSIIGSMYAFLCENGLDNKAYDFFEKLCRFNFNGSESMKSLTTSLTKNKTFIRKLNRDTILALLIKTWNLYFKDRDTKMIKYADEENFPELLIK